MTIIREAAEEYHKRPAVSASLLWDIVKPDGCLAQAKHDSRWLNPDYTEERNENLAFGSLAHLAILENHLLEDRIEIIAADNWRSNAAQSLRDSAYANGKIPLLEKRTEKTPMSSYTFEDLMDLKKAVQNSDAAKYFFGEGESEVSYTWFVAGGLEAKARADRLKESSIFDLKTSQSASPAAFRRAMLRDGHHLRAAWYKDGWVSSQDSFVEKPDYLFVVVSKEKPHLVSVFRCDERAIEWGRRLYKKGLDMLRLAIESDKWPGYVGDVTDISLPGFAEWDYADMERAGEL